jgi:hypothetical protein
LRSRPPRPLTQSRYVDMQPEGRTTNGGRKRLLPRSDDASSFRQFRKGLPMKVSEIMTRDVEIVSPDDSIRTAARMLVDGRGDAEKLAVQRLAERRETNAAARAASCQVARCCRIWAPGCLARAAPHRL